MLVCNNALPHLLSHIPRTQWWSGIEEAIHCILRSPIGIHSVIPQAGDELNKIDRAVDSSKISPVKELRSDLNERECNPGRGICMVL